MLPVTLVVIESPYAGDTEKNTRYLRAAMRDCLMKGEAPFASHGLYTLPGVLSDADPHERKLGTNAGFEWATRAHRRVVYADLGVSSGMIDGIEHAESIRQPVEWRYLGPCWEDFDSQKHDT